MNGGVGEEYHVFRVGLPRPPRRAVTDDIYELIRLAAVVCAPRAL